jgi:hypothetical protein
MKKLQVAVAVASLFASSGAVMAASISQSGVTIAREVISPSATSAQQLTAPSVTFNFDNGPTANAASSQDFSITLTLGGAGTPAWSTALSANIFRSVSATRRGNQAVVPVVASGTTAAGAFAIELLSAAVQTRTNTNDTIRYRFRLVNNQATAIGLGDLQMGFNTVNPGAAPLDADYAQVTNLQTSVSAIVGSTVGVDGNPAGCANEDTRVTVVGRNYIGSGDGVIGESGEAGVINNGFILFQQALNIYMGKGVAPNRATDPTASNQLLTPGVNTFGATTRMVLGYVKFANRVGVDAWDTSIEDNYYKYSRPGAAPLDGDLGTFGVLQDDGDVDTSNLVVRITSTNGFAAGKSFTLTNNPYGVTGAAGAVGVNSGAAGVIVNAAVNGDPNVIDVSFSHAALVSAANTGAAQSLLGSTGAVGTVPGYVATTDRYYLNYIVPGNTAIPLSNFSAVSTLVKEVGSNEQANISCPAPLAGLGGGVKIDVRNFFPYNAADTIWTGVIRVINNDENVAADLTGQYIRADGKYGKWGSLGSLPARGARYFTSKEINDLLTQNSSLAGADNSGPGGIAPVAGQALQPNTRLRISSDQASTLRVQSYIYNANTQALVEVSASQGADFINVESSARDHIDQDAQTGIKK